MKSSVAMEQRGKFGNLDFPLKCWQACAGVRQLTLVSSNHLNRLFMGLKLISLSVYKSTHIHKYFKSWATCFEDQTEHFLSRNYTFSPAGDISWNVSAAFSLMQYVVQTYHLCGNVKVLPFRCLLHNLSSWWHEKTFLCSNRWLPGWVGNKSSDQTYKYISTNFFTDFSNFS